MIHAERCGGRGEAASDPVDRGVSLCRVVVTLRPGVGAVRTDPVSRHIDLLSWLFVAMHVGAGVCQ